MFYTIGQKHQGNIFWSVQQDFLIYVRICRKVWKIRIRIQISIHMKQSRSIAGLATIIKHTNKHSLSDQQNAHFTPLEPHLSPQHYQARLSAHKLKGIASLANTSPSQDLTLPHSRKLPNRKLFPHRPQTSKGSRPLNASKNANSYHSSHSQSQYLSQAPVDDAVEEQDATFPDIPVIVTHSRGQGGQSRLDDSKFDTDLDDEFLQLFAN